AALAATAEELHGVGDHLDGLALGAVLCLPLAPLEPAVDADGAALGEVLRAVLALRAPDGDVEVVRLLRPLAGGRVLAARVHGAPEAADGHAARRVPELRIACEVADEDDAIDICHGPTPPLLPLPNACSDQRTQAPRRRRARARSARARSRRARAARGRDGR